MHGKFELPRSVGQLTKDEISELLYKALKVTGIETQAELARLSGIPGGTLNNYFRKEYIPPQENWNVLRKVFNPPDTVSSVCGANKSDINEDVIRNRARKIRSLVFLLKDEIAFFEDSSIEVRDLLKSCLDNEETGYVLSLLRALFDDKVFQMRKVIKEGVNLG